MRITKMTLCICAALGSTGTIAQTSNEQMHTHSHAIMPMPTTTLKDTHLAYQESDEAQHHRDQHGGQWYQATQVDTQWMVNTHGKGAVQSELRSWWGTDENKLYLKAELEKEESESASRNISMRYSRMISDFWDIQTGLRYRDDASESADEALDGVIALHGLAPYFFETDLSLYVGAHGYTGLSVETERDVLLTQKIVIKPYLKADIVISDQSSEAAKTGLNELKTGLQTRYEINKKVMPFIDVAYHYKQHPTALFSVSDRAWWYGAGVTFKF